MSNIVDLHTHIFNVLFLPIEGIAMNWCREHNVKVSVGKTAAKLLNAIAHAHSGRFAGNDAAARNEARRADSLLTAAESAKHGEDDVLLDDLADRLPDTALADDDLFEAFAKTSGSLRARKRLVVGGALRDMHRAVPKELFKTVTGWVRWVFLLTLDERVIFFVLRLRHRGVDLYVTHLMDMDAYYEDGDSEYDFFGVQVDWMLQVQKSHCKRMRTFVAYDPKREHEIEKIEHALKSGCSGVKFYPPNGYAPIGNGKKIDGTLREFYDFCVANDVPVFTHCTPVGVEAQKGYGCKSDPELWRRVLDHPKNTHWKKLRLCFGHAGGEVGWFGLTPRPRWCERPKDTFADEVIAICSTKKYPNVYCELGYLNEVRKKESALKLQSKLIAAIAASENGRELASRIYFRTDWHMPEMFIKGTRVYVNRLRDVFKHEKLKEHASAFFAGNARRFLKMSK